MRVDKFLKVSRLIKRRTVAKEASIDCKILVNGKIAKPSTEIKVDDIIQINYYKQIVKVRVKELINSSKKNDSLEMYDVIEVIENNLNNS